MTTEPSSYQVRYWNFLKELKVHVLYLNSYATQSERWDKAINIFLALTSSTSIAAWALWQKYTFMWAGIIALSQVVTAVKPFLPYRDRLKAVVTLGNSLQELSLECEKYWYSVAEGDLTEKEIHELCSELKNKSFAAEKRNLKGNVLPKKEKLLKRAEADADIYFLTNYHPEA